MAIEFPHRAPNPYRNVQLEELDCGRGGLFDRDCRLADCREQPTVVCILRTTSSMPASCSGVAPRTRSGPSATMFSSSSVTIVAISTITLRTGSSPVISRSIQASTEAHRSCKLHYGAMWCWRFP